MCFNRVIANEQIVLTSSYRQSRRSRDDIVRLEDGNIGKALKVVKLNDLILLLFLPFRVMGNAKFGKGCKIPHIYELEKIVPQKIIAVKASNIKDKCIFIKYRQRRYACLKPNMVEYG